MSVTLANLIARRTKLRDDMIALQKRADDADPDTGAMTPEQQQAFDALKAALVTLEAAISNRAAVNDFERAAPGRVLAGGDEKLENRMRAFRPGIAIAGAAGLRVDDGPEREISAEMARRSGRKVEGILIPFQAFDRPIERRVVTPSGTGAGIVGTYLDGNMYVDALRAAVISAKLGARYVTGLDTQVDWPRLSATATAQWVADGSAVTTDTAETFNKLSLRPHTLGGVVEFTRQMLLTSTPEIQDAARNDLLQVVARALDLASLDGSGSPDPTGILNTSGLTVVPGGTNGAAITWPNVLAVIEAAQNANAPEENLGFASNPRVRASAMGTLRFSGVAAGTIMEKPDELAGYPFHATTQIPLGTKGTASSLSTLIFGSWSELVIALWGEGIEVLTNPYSSPQFNSGNVAVRVMATADIGIRHIASFAAITDLIAA